MKLCSWRVKSRFKLCGQSRSDVVCACASPPPPLPPLSPLARALPPSDFTVLATRETRGRKTDFIWCISVSIWLPRKLPTRSERPGCAASSGTNAAATTDGGDVVLPLARFDSSSGRGAALAKLTRRLMKYMNRGGDTAAIEAKSLVSSSVSSTMHARRHAACFDLTNFSVTRTWCACQSSAWKPGKMIDDRIHGQTSVGSDGEVLPLSAARPSVGTVMGCGVLLGSTLAIVRGVRGNALSDLQPVC